MGSVCFLGMCLKMEWRRENEREGGCEKNWEFSFSTVEGSFVLFFWSWNLEFGIWWWRFLLIVEGEKEKAWKQKKMGGTGVRTRGRCWKIFKVGKRGGKEGVKGRIEKVAVNKTVKIFAGLVSVWNSSLGAKTVKLWGGEWKEPKNDWPKLGLSAHFFNLYGFFF